MALSEFGTELNTELMSSNRSQVSFQESLNISERSKLLSFAESSQEQLNPAEIAQDPVAAENFNIEKRFLSVVLEKVSSPSAQNIGAGNSDDSFDWLEDDRDLYEITKGLYTGPPVTLKSNQSLYDNVQPDNPQAVRLDERREYLDSDEDESDSDYSLLPKKIYFAIILTIQVLLLTLSILSICLGFDFGSLVGMPMQIWFILGLIIAFVPFVCSWSLKIIVKILRHSGANGELPNFIDSLRLPLNLLTSTMVAFTFWFRYFPRSCPPTDNPVSFCFYEIVDKIFYGLVLTALGFAAEIMVMFFATLKFHERTFKDRIINCRFKIYVVQQMALKALDAEHQRVNKSGSLSSSRIRDMSRADRDEDDGTEESNSYFENLLSLIGSFFKTSTNTIVSESQRAIGNAANFVQIQVEDSEATVPITHSSSQSYEKFSKKLRKHMKLYGYSQFAQNNSGLKDNEARILARDLFHFLCPSDRNFMTLGDLAPCFASSQAANDAYDIFDQDQDGIISKKEFRNTVVAIYADLRDLTKSIRLAGSALKKLDVILKIVFVVGLSLVLLTMFSFNVMNMLTLFLSVIIGLNFMIGDLAKHFLSSLFLLFVTHPFDIGDTIVVGLFEEGCYLKDILTVKHMNLMTTVFTRWNGQETYVPNHMLANAPFMTNLSRTVEQWEMVEFKVPSLTPESALTDLRQKIGSFLQMHDTYYYKVFDLHAIVAADMAESEKNIDELEFNLRVKCKPTSDAQKRWARHAKLLKFIKVTLEKSIYSLVEKEST